jgi:L-asparaginase
LTILRAKGEAIMHEEKSPHALPKVVLMTTGGTIGTAFDYSSRISGAELLSLATGAERFARIEVDQADARPSPVITPCEMIGLAKRVAMHLARPEVAGIVVTYGTDAMDEFVYLLHLTIASVKPVVVTGAMLHTKGPFPDGPRNLLHAIITAASPDACGFGTMLVMNGAIHSAGEVIKVNAASIEAFASPKYGPIGMVEGDRAVFRRRPVLEPPFSGWEIEPNVDLIAASVGMDNRFIEASVAAGARGLVMMAMGGGALAGSMYQRLQELAGGGFPVVIATRCIRGSVIARPRGDSQAWLFAAGDLPAHKARIKLMLALAAIRHASPAEARRILAGRFA